MIKGTVFRTRTRIEWMGRHSGYDRGCDFLEDWADDWSFIDVSRSVKGFGPIRRRYLDWRRAGCSDSPLYDAASYRLERDLERSLRRHRPGIVHLMYLETDLGLLSDRSRTEGSCLIATTHQPRSWWKLVHGKPEAVRSLDGLIVLTDREAEFWSEFLPDRVFLAPHGVDVDFFCPSEDERFSASKTEPRCLIVGHWMRDLRTISEAVNRLSRRYATMAFDFVIPLAARAGDELYRIARHDSVAFHAGLSDRELRDLYRRSTLLLLPLVDATANNAILEATACGTPIVSTDIPGVASYVEPTFADLLPVGDVTGTVNAVERIVETQGERQSRGFAAREHAVKNLSWRKLAPRWLEIYRAMVSVES